MSSFDHLPDDATRLSASLRSHFSGSGKLTLIGWITRFLLLVVLLGAGMVTGRLLGPVIYALLN